MNNGFSRIFKIYFKYLVDYQLIVKISVLVALYNTEKYIIQCLESIKNQTFTDFECIIIDDSSTDNSYSIAKEYIKDDSRFSIHQIQHSGLSVVRNKGIELAKGKYIHFCDSDDFLYPSLLETTVDYAEKNNLDMLFFDADTLCDTLNTRQCNIEKGYFNRTIPEIISSGRKYFRYCFYQNKLILTSFTYIIRKDAIKYLFYPDIYYQCELHTIQNMLIQEKIGHIRKKLYCKRTRDNSSLSQDKTYKHSQSYSIISEELKKYSETEDLPQNIRLMLNDLSKKYQMYAEKIRGIKAP